MGVYKWIGRKLTSVKMNFFCTMTMFGRLNMSLMTDNGKA